MTSLNLVDACLSNALHSKWRRDTFFLVTTDKAKIVPVWTKSRNYQSASSFLLEMGGARGLEKRWWTPSAQMEVESGAVVCHDHHAAAAQQVISMASVTLEWFGLEVLTWVAMESCHQFFDLFQIRVVLRLEQ
ncbi:hypothetical protein BDV10DRAFT_187731 [Aspergillus recurvatus]